MRWMSGRRDRTGEVEWAVGCCAVAATESGCWKRGIGVGAIGEGSEMCSR
jgi:hypothetical protein